MRLKSSSESGGQTLSDIAWMLADGCLVCLPRARIYACIRTRRTRYFSARTVRSVSTALTRDRPALGDPGLASDSSSGIRARSVPMTIALSTTSPPRPSRRRVQYVRRLDQLEQLTASERERLKPVTDEYVFRANDYYLSLIDWGDAEDPIRQGNTRVYEQDRRSAQTVRRSPDNRHQCSSLGTVTVRSPPIGQDGPFTVDIVPLHVDRSLSTRSRVTSRTHVERLRRERDASRRRSTMVGGAILAFVSTSSARRVVGRASRPSSTRRDALHGRHTTFDVGPRRRGRTTPAIAGASLLVVGVPSSDHARRRLSDVSSPARRIDGRRQIGRCDPCLTPFTQNGCPLSIGPDRASLGHDASDRRCGGDEGRGSRL